MFRKPPFCPKMCFLCSNEDFDANLRSLDLCFFNLVLSSTDIGKFPCKMFSQASQIT